MSMKPPYCEIHGLVCTDVIQSVEVDGADLNVSTHATPGKRFSEVLEQGRNPRKITLKARFLTEADLDEWIAHVNAAPEDCEVYPFRDDRCAYVKYAHAQVTDSEPASINGEYTTFHKGKATLHTKEPWVYGVEKGVLREAEQVLPAAATIQHAGTVNALTCLDKITMRGSFRWKRPARLIAAASDTVIAVVRDDDSIQLVGIGVPAIELPALPLGVSPISIAARSENMLWAVGEDYNVYTWDPVTLDGLSWNLLSAQSINIAKISVATDGTMAAMASDGKAYVWSGGSWVELSGKTATDIFCMAANEIYIVESDTNCWKHNGSSWSQISSTPALSRVSGTRDGTKQLCALDTEDQYLILSGSAWGLDDLGGGTELAAININKVFFIGIAGELFVQYAPAPLINGIDRIIVPLEDFYATNVGLSFTPATYGVTQQLVICSKLMRSDIFEVDRYGNIEHRYETDFDLSATDFQTDLGKMPDYTPHSAWFSIANSKLTIDSNARVIFQFCGPMPISAEKPYMEFNATAISSGGPRIVVGHAADQSDLVEVPASLHLGYNKIWIPNQEGQTDLLVGFIERRCWAQAANMITPRGWAVGGGDDDSALVASGSLAWDYNWLKINNPEEFNGTAWSIANSLAAIRVKAAGDGDSSDGICFGGLGNDANNPLQSTEEYNGTSWSAGGNLCIERYWHSGGGGSADAISVYGHAAYPQWGYTEVYNGTAWSTDATTVFLPDTVGRGGGGDSADAIVSGGTDFSDASDYYSQVEHYNGTAWDGDQGRLGTARRDLVSRSTLAFGGFDGYVVTSVTEEFDGTVWAAGSHLITPRGQSTGGGGYLSGICAGGLRAMPRSDMYDGCQNTETYGRNGAIELEDLKAVVRRYIDPAEIPTVDPGDEFELKVDAGGAQMLEYLEMYFRDAWWL